MPALSCTQKYGQEDLRDLVMHTSDMRSSRPQRYHLDDTSDISTCVFMNTKNSSLPCNIPRINCGKCLKHSVRSWTIFCYCSYQSMSRNSLSSVLARADLFLQHLVTSTPEITEESYNMDKSLYLADSPPTVVRLDIAPHFSALNAQQKRYAHHLSRYNRVSSARKVFADFGSEQHS